MLSFLVSLIHSNLYILLGYLLHTIMSSLNKGILVSSIPVIILLNFFSLCYTSQILNTMLNRNGNRRHYCLIPNFWEKVFNILLSMILNEFKRWYLSN